MHFTALDTETCMIAERPCLVRDKGQFIASHSSTRGARVIYTGPFEIPRLLFGSFCDGTVSGVLPRAAFLDQVRALLPHADTHLVFHNAPFDLNVLGAADPELWPLFWEALEDGRIHDTQILDVLYRLSNGYFDTLTPPDYTACKPVRSRSLEELAKVYCEMVLNKDPAVRLGFEQFEGRVLPEGFREYALQDAVATHGVFMKLYDKRVDDKLWSELIQVRAAVALSSLDRRGLYINRAEANRLRALFERDLPALEVALAQAGLGRFEPMSRTRTRVKLPLGTPIPLLGWRFEGDGLTIVRSTPYKKHVVKETAMAQFHLNTKALRETLMELAQEEGIQYESTPTGQLCLDAEFWAYYTPPQHAGLLAWVQYEKVSKIVGTYLKLYSSTDRVFPRWNVMGARSGRMSCSSPNVQNIPKRKYGIRSLFVPRPGRVFVRADYKTQELLTLAEAMILMGIKGPLCDAITSGRDIHTQTASLLTGVDVSAVTKEQRQAAKACAFGVPGGLGPKKLADYAQKEYGVTWTLEEAKEKRSLFLTGYPDIKAYLERLNTDFVQELMRISGRGVSSWRETLHVTSPGVRALKMAMAKHSSVEVRRLLHRAERALTVTLPSGRVRKGCQYTEAANTHFQGSASDVTKAAAFKAIRLGLEVALVVHDEIVIEAPPDNYRGCAKALERCMLDAFKEVCPNVGPYALVEIEAPLRCWGHATDAAGQDI